MLKYIFFVLVTTSTAKYFADGKKISHRIALLDVEHGALEVRRLAQLRGDVGDEAVVKDGIVFVVLTGRGRR